MMIVVVVTFLIVRCELTTTQPQWLLQLLQPTFLNQVLVGLLLLLNRFVHITLYLVGQYWFELGMNVLFP